MFAAAGAAIIAAAPKPSPSPEPLTEIGRVRAVTPICAVVRDAVVPSIEAIHAADERWKTVASDHLQRFARLNASREGPDVGTSAAVFQINRDGAALLAFSKKIADALGDPRIAENAGDKDTQTVRASLQRLFEMQRDRAMTLTEFGMRRGMSEMRQDTKGPATRGEAVQPVATDDPDRIIPGMPRLHGSKIGLSMADEEAMRDWTTTVSTRIAAGQRPALRNLLPIVEGCR